MTVYIFALLIFGHALADYPLQGPYLSSAKNRFNPIPNTPWYQAMTWHCVIHAGFVGIITQSLFLAFLEFMAHFIIDYNKCADRIDYNTDQALHVFCKALWVLLIWSGLP